VHASRNSRGILIGLAFLATTGLAACAAHGTPSSAGPTNGQTATAAANASAAASQPATAPSPAPTGIQNLVISSADKSQLTAAFVAFKGISLSDVNGGGPSAGSVYYAYDPSTDTYWALASFAPSSTASLDVQVGFQDGGGTAMYQKAGAGPWQMGGNPGFPEFCGEVKYFPAAVLTAWSMATTAPPGLTC
jgi:hypothetical protein